MKDPVLIANQVVSVFAFLLTLWFTFLGTEICAAISMLLLLIAACRDLKKVGCLEVGSVPVLPMRCEPNANLPCHRYRASFTHQLCCPCLPLWEVFFPSFLSINFMMTMNV